MLEHNEDWVAREASRGLIDFTDEDKLLLTALKKIRQATGTIFARDLYFILGEHGTEHTDAPDRDVLQRLNSWFDAPLVLVDRGSTHTAGLVELVTDVQYRVFIDLLTGFLDNKRPRLHPVSGTVSARAAQGVVINWTQAPLVYPSRSERNRRDAWIDIVRGRYEDIIAEQSRMRAVTEPQELASLVTTDPVAGVIELDLSSTYIENFCATDLLSLAIGFPRSPRIRLRAHGAVFAGSRTDFSDAHFDVLDMEWAVFTSPTVSFERATFDCITERDEDPEHQRINLRDTTFCDSVRDVLFDDMRTTGDTRRISFEDAVFRGSRVAFARADMNRAVLDFYQTQFLAGSRVEFIETKMAESRLAFTDSFFETSSSASGSRDNGSVVFYRVDPLAPTDLAARKIDDIRIENSVIQAPMRFANARRISFSGTSISGTAITVKPPTDPDTAARGGVVGAVWFFDAVQNGRESHRSTLSAEFAAIKEVFHGMGEYDLEDEAFVRHMRFKYSGVGGRTAHALLDSIGRFGTSPYRTFGWLIAAWCAFVLINMACMSVAPDAFVGSLGSIPLDAIVYTNASLTQSSAAISPGNFAVHLLWVVQTLLGWFFLGYLFSAFVRKTLR